MPRGVYDRTPEGRANMSKAQLARAPPTSDTKSRLSKALLGMRKSLEHCKSISESKMGDKNPMYGVRGGEDVINHHVAYDFGNPLALRVEITREFHGMIHHPKGIPVTDRGYSLID